MARDEEALTMVSECFLPHVRGYACTFLLHALLHITCALAQSENGSFWQLNKKYVLGYVFKILKGLD